MLGVLGLKCGDKEGHLSSSVTSLWELWLLRNVTKIHSGKRDGEPVVHAGVCQVNKSVAQALGVGAVAAHMVITHFWL